MATIGNPTALMGRMFAQTRGALRPEVQPPQLVEPPPQKPLVLTTGGPQPPTNTGVVPPHLRTGGPSPPTSRPLPTLYTGGPLPPGQVVPRSGGLLPRTGGPGQRQPMAQSTPGLSKAPGLPRSQEARMPSTNAQGMRMPTANPVGRPAGGLFKGM